MAQTQSDEDLIYAAIIDVESSGRGFTASGRVRTRLELHHLPQPLKFPFKYADGQKSWRGRDHQMAACPIGNVWVNIHTDDSVEGIALMLAIASYGSDAAFHATSMGLGQIMGFNAETCGFETPTAMYREMDKGPDEQREVMLRFINANARRRKAIEERNWYEFAKRYNGTGQMEHYGNLIRDRLPDHLKGPEFSG